MLFTICGIIGALLAIVAYGALVLEKVGDTLRLYYVLNLISCAFIGVSLLGQFNVGTLMIELFFAGASIWGLIHKDPATEEFTV